MIKCHRRVCNNPADERLTHRDNMEAYCVECAKLINKANPEADPPLFAFPIEWISKDNVHTAKYKHATAELVFVYSGNYARYTITDTRDGYSTTHTTTIGTGNAEKLTCERWMRKFCGEVIK